MNWSNGLRDEGHKGLRGQGARWRSDPRRAPFAAERGRRGFTIIELLVVIGMIVLILAVAVPGLSAIALQARLNNATQTINGALTRAYYSALENTAVTAVRFVPGQWDFNEKADKNQPQGRQHVVTYTYTGTTAANPNVMNQNAPGNYQFGEYFARQTGNASIQLPEDIWVAPIETLDMSTRSVPVDNDGDGKIDPTYQTYNNFGANCLLTGAREVFDLKGAAISQSNGFMKAEDFLVAFDPQTGARSGLPTPMPIKAQIPGKYINDPSNRGVESDHWPLLSGNYFRRYNFSGIVIYQREAFTSLLASGDPTMLQYWLRKNGHPFLVHHFGGGLVMGTQYSK